jgi:hypothetical protein
MADDSLYMRGLQMALTVATILAAERARGWWRRRCALRRRLQFPQAPETASLRYYGEAQWIGWGVAAFFAALAMAALYAHSFGPATLFATFSLVGLALATYSRAVAVSYDPYSVTTTWRNRPFADILWKDVARVEMASQPGLVLVDRNGKKLPVPLAMIDFDALCAAVLRRLPVGTPISMPATAVLLENARADNAELVRLYVPHYLAEAQIHNFLWDPNNDPYESWQEVTFLLAYRLHRCRNNFVPYVLALESDGKVHGRVGLEPPCDSRSWSSCEQHGEQARIRTLVEGGTVRQIDVPLSSKR